MKKFFSLVFVLSFTLLMTGCKSDSKLAFPTKDVTELKIETLQEGDGEVAKAGSFAIVDYDGYLTDGTKFDSSRDRGTPFKLTLGSGQVISGWDQGIVGMKVGETRRLTIPPTLAYGENGIGPIPGNATLIFEVELLELKSLNEVIRDATKKKE